MAKERGQNHKLMHGLLQVSVSALIPHYSTKKSYALVSEITKESLRLSDGVTERVRSD